MIILQATGDFEEHTRYSAFVRKRGVRWRQGGKTGFKSIQGVAEEAERILLQDRG
jgi:hypothetical protein